MLASMACGRCSAVTGCSAWGASEEGGQAVKWRKEGSLRNPRRASPPVQSPPAACSAPMSPIFLAEALMSEVALPRISSCAAHFLPMRTNRSLG